MGRRKKEPKSVHRENISAAAQNLFLYQGIENTSMDDIARAAGYSKATLYVYFKNKEELIGLLVLESMKKLHGYILSAIKKEAGTKSRYLSICHGLVRYQEEFPFYFTMVLGEINIDFQAADCLPEEEETYHIGEEINNTLGLFLKEGISSGDLRADLPILPTIFSFWGMLSGLIQLAASKEAYMNQELQLTKQNFLLDGFETLYRAIENRGEHNE